MGEHNFKAVDGMTIGERDQCSRGQHAFQVIAVFQRQAPEGTVSIPRVVCAKCGSTIDPFADIADPKSAEPKELAGVH